MGALDGRVALVTGAAQGQGAAIARHFVKEGATVVLTDVLDDLGRALAGELGSSAQFVHLDVTDEDGWSRAVGEAEERNGKLDGLVNNAGILRSGGIVDTSLTDFEAVVRVNQIGVFLGMRAVVPCLRRAGGGTIVNTSSIAGLVGLAGLAAYTATKFAVRGLTKAAALELAPDGIRVNAVLPGRVDTQMARGGEGGRADAMGIPLGRVASVDDVARAVLYLSSDASAFCTGTDLVLDGGVTAGPVAVPAAPIRS